MKLMNVERGGQQPILNFLPPVITVLTDVELDMTAHPVAIKPLSLLPVGKSVSVVSCIASHYWAEVGGVLSLS